MAAPKKSTAKKATPKKTASTTKVDPVANLEKRLSALEAQVKEMSEATAADFANDFTAKMQLAEEQLRGWLMTAPLIKVAGIILAILILLWIF